MRPEDVGDDLLGDAGRSTFKGCAARPVQTCVLLSSNMMRRRLALLVASSSLVSCAGRRDVYVRYGDIHRHLGELRAQGHAIVEATETDAERTNNATHDSDTATTVDLRIGQIALLAEGCSDVPPFRGTQPSAGCELTLKRDAHLVVDNRPDRLRTHNVVAFGAGLLTLGGAGGAIYCGIACDSYRAEKIGVMAGAALVSLLVWVVASGGHD